MASEDHADILKGTTLKVYRYLLERSEPVGVREVQRALNLSSSSLATYHLSKLEDSGLLRRENGDYLVDKVLFENSIRISHLLIPKHLFYFVLGVSILTIELTYLRPTIPTREYFFSTVSILVFTLIFVYETVKTWVSNRL